MAEMVPGLQVLNAFQQARDLSANENARNLQAVGALQSIIQRQRALQMDQQYRQAMANAKTPEEQAAAAAQAAGPQGVLNYAGTQARIKSAQEMGMARLQQAAINFQQNLDLRMRAAKTQEERLALSQSAEAFKQNIQREAQRIAGASAQYNFGFLPNPPTEPTVTAPQPQGPQSGVTIQGDFPEASANLQNVSPTLLAKAASLNPDLAAVVNRAGVSLPQTSVPPPTAPAPNGPGWMPLSRRAQDQLSARQPHTPVAVIGPDGKPVLVAPEDAIGKVPYKPGADRPMTEVQGKAAMYGSRAAQSDKVLQSLEDKINLTGLAAGQAAGTAGNFFLSSDQRRVDQAQRDFVNAILRQESGAAIAQSEFDNAKKQYFPQPGDDAKTIAQKRANRKLAIEGFARMSGQQGAADIQAIINNPLLPGTEQKPTTGPKDGEKATSKSGKPMTFRNGRWEYD